MKNNTPQPIHSQALHDAVDRAGNLNAVARRTGISRRRLGKIKAGSPMSIHEHTVIELLTQGKV
jgi:DNA-binding phage protein